MAWRWLEGLLGRNKSRWRRNDPKRRLRIEELESRRLLTIVSIGGVIDVSNFPGATGDVPVRGIHVHAWIGDNNVYNPNPNPSNPAAGLNGTGSGGVYADVYTNDVGMYLISMSTSVPLTQGDKIHIVAIAESNKKAASQYMVIQSPGPPANPSPAVVYTSQFDDQVTTDVNDSPLPMFWDPSHNDILAAPALVNSQLPATPGKSQQVALAFAAFSIMKTSYDFATTDLHAALAPQIFVAMPGTKDTAAAYGSTEIVLRNNDLLVPDTIGHEFGHLVANKGGFMGDTADNVHHFLDTNQRTLPPTTADDATATGAVSAVDLDVAWDEGFADWYAVACKTAISTAGLNIPQMTSDTAAPKLYVRPGNNEADYYLAAPDVTETTGGWGEDNEISVMRILWQYSHANGWTDAKLYETLTVLDVYQKPLNTLSAFWNVVTPSGTTTPSAAANVTWLIVFHCHATDRAISWELKT